MTDVGYRRPRRGEVWLIALGAARKGEIGKTRPALVVSVDGLQLGTAFDRITVVPLSANPRQRSSFLQPVCPAGHGLDHDSVVLCDAPRAVVPSRFERYLGEVSDELLAQVVEARSFIEGWDE